MLEGFCFAAFLCLFFSRGHTEQTNKKERGSRHTHARKQKITKENSTQKRKWKHGECDHVKKKGRKKQRSKNMKIKYPTPLKMAMYAETCSETVKTNTLKLHADGNITCNTH
jgi:hypothetical protein